MGFFRKFTNFESHPVVRKASETDVPTDSDSEHLDLADRNEKEIQRHPDRVTQDAQLGVKKAEAVALVWPKAAVYATYAWIWVAFFMLALQQGTTTLFNAAAYADFAAAP